MAKKRTEEATPTRNAVVSQLYAEEGYGYLITPDNREIRFTRDTVLRDEFDELRLGSEVLYEVEGEQGDNATSVDLQSVPLPPPDGVDEPLGGEDEVPEMPDPWQEK